ncbi:hypothetical protein A2707_06045 [Candidatus Saccharibacteria bacterium RIFCSPHIGHO2_01_FULL_45_15]|nr:MAG: hypothetical protein A2707_06045 [Candidatus Saccharibacteria bacterium RIFCSPHIGHO2_01_FULL_45_15]OGL27567.1 MAG: hypothetical protein A3C39_04690 [Candidatus Saccharibacteria bacterium RIFCSPHIGHO2_02_FULL_46_12]OGL32021.1 MAG: hypothetical protein A3E76_01990 [Candidatus Saccharibacteria bacterium RIFCSPHIGHO2_12_FULL_44_22]
MDTYITKDALLALGINLGDQDIDSLLAHLNDTVEERIGAEITESLSDEQLQELIDLQDNATDEEVGDWIAKHVPDYKEIVQDNIDIVIGELVDGADEVNQAA